MVLSHALLKGWNPLRQFSQVSSAGKILIATFAAWGIFTSATSSFYPLFSVVFFCRLLLHILLLGALLWVISEGRSFDRSRWFATYAAAGGIYVGLLAIFCLLVPDPASFLWVKLIPSATNVRQIGNVVGLIALIPTAMIIFEKTLKKTAAPFALLTFMLGFIFWTGTRGAVVGYLLALGASLIWVGSFAAFRKTGLLLLSGLIAFLGSHFLPKPAPEFGMIRIVESVTSGGDSDQRTDGNVAQCVGLYHGIASDRLTEQELTKTSCSLRMAIHSTTPIIRCFSSHSIGEFRARYLRLPCLAGWVLGFYSKVAQIANWVGWPYPAIYAFWQFRW